MVLKDHSFPKEARLLNAADFSYLKFDSHAFKSKSCLVFFKPSRVSSRRLRVGFAVTRKVGKAHRRNRLKRLLREFFRFTEIKNFSFDVTVVISQRLDKSGLNEQESEKILMKDIERFQTYFLKTIQVPS